MERRYFSFKRIVGAYFFCFMAFSVLGGLLALFHINAVYFNETPRYGIEGFAIAILFIPISGMLFGALNWVFLNFGDYLYVGFLKLFKKGTAK